MYKIEFINLVEVRMGSPFNVAEVVLSGKFIPDLSASSFQDVSVVSSDGEKCFLVEWLFERGDPGFCIWMLDENKKSVQKSKRFFGCCEGLDLKNSKLVIKFWRFNPETKKGLHLVDEIAVDAALS